MTVSEFPAAMRRVLTARGSVFGMLFSSLWKFFTSVRVALWLIGATIAWTMLATLAQSTLPAKIAGAVPAVAAPMQRWNSWAVWNSPLYLGTLLLLVISIICGGMINRWPGIRRRIWNPTITTSPGFFSGLKHSETFMVTPETDAAAVLMETLRHKRYRALTKRDERTGSMHVYADRYRHSLLATFPFHTALVLLLVGAAIIALFGWREIGFLVPDGSMRPIGHGTDLTIKNLRFADDYYDSGRPRDFYSDIEIFEGGELATSGRLRVNTPLHHGDVSIHQAGFGQAAKFVVTDATSGQSVFDDSIPIFVAEDRQYASQFVDEGGTFRPAGQRPFDELGLSLFVIGSGGATDQSIKVGQMGVAIFDTGTQERIGSGILNQGETLAVAGHVFTFQREVRFTGLQITYAPGLTLIYIASAILVASTIFTLYLPQRRVRALVMPQPDGRSLLRIAAQVRLDLLGAREYETIVQAFRERTGATIAPDIKDGKQTKRRERSAP